MTDHREPGQQHHRDGSADEHRAALRAQLSTARRAWNRHGQAQSGAGYQPAQQQPQDVAPVARVGQIQQSVQPTNDVSVGQIAQQSAGQNAVAVPVTANEAAWELDFENFLRADIDAMDRAQQPQDSGSGISMPDAPPAESYPSHQFGYGATSSMTEDASGASGNGFHQQENFTPTADLQPQHPTFRQMWPDAELSWPRLAAEAGLEQPPAQLELPMPDGSSLYYWLPRQHEFDAWDWTDAQMFVHFFRTLGIYVNWAALDANFLPAQNHGLSTPTQPLAQSNESANSQQETAPVFTPGGPVQSDAQLDDANPGALLAEYDWWNGVDAAGHNESHADSMGRTPVSTPHLTQPDEPVMATAESLPLPDAQSPPSIQRDAREQQDLPEEEEPAEEVGAGFGTPAVGEDQHESEVVEQGDRRSEAVRKSGGEQHGEHDRNSEDSQDEDRNDGHVGGDTEDTQDPSATQNTNAAPTASAVPATTPAPLRPSSATSKVTLKLRTAQELQDCRNKRRVAQTVDPSLPTTWAARLPHVLRIKQAMMDTAHAGDKPGPGYNRRWSGAPGKFFYEEEAFEVLAHELCDRTIEYVRWGPGIFICYDKGHNKKYDASFNTLTFNERIDKIVELLLKSKDRVNSLMKHQGLDDVVGFPEKLIDASTRNHEFNVKRAGDLAFAKAARTADPGTPVDQIDSAVRKGRATKSSSSAHRTKTEATVSADAEEAAGSSTVGGAVLAETQQGGAQDAPAAGTGGAAATSQGKAAASKGRQSRSSKGKTRAAQQAPAPAFSGRPVASSSTQAQPSGQPPASRSKKSTQNAASKSASTSSSSLARKRLRPAAVEAAAEPSSAPKRRRTTPATAAAQPAATQIPTPADQTSPPVDNWDLYAPPSPRVRPTTQPRSQAASAKSATSTAQGQQSVPLAAGSLPSPAPTPADSAAASPSIPTSRKRPAETEAEPSSPPKRGQTGTGKVRRERSSSPEA